MIRATAGTWINYATTIVFQVLVAAKFGASPEATAFSICFAGAISIAFVAVSSAQSIALPRLLDPSGGVRPSALRVLGLLFVGSIAIAVAATLGSGAIATHVLSRTGLPPHELRLSVDFAAAFGVTQVAAGQAAAFALVRGQRFIPAVAPAVPSTTAAAVLLLSGNIGISRLFLALLVGGVLEIAFLLPAATRGLNLGVSTGERLHLMTGLTVVQFVCLAALMPLEISLASWSSPSGGAEYAYAIRSLAVAQQLLVGGIALASIGQWSGFSTMGDAEALARSVMRRVGLAIPAICVAAAVAAVAARPLVGFVYERGDFSPAATARVASVLIAALPGFAFESMSIVLSQLFVAQRRNALAIAMGMLRFVLRAGLAFVLAPRYGAVGVAYAYSIGSCVVGAIQMAIVASENWYRISHDRLIRGGATIGAATVAAALLALIARTSAPIGAVVVAAVFATVAAGTLALVRESPGRQVEGT